MRHIGAALLASIGILIAAPAEAQMPAQGWISHPEAAAAPVVLQFRRTVDLPRRPRIYPVRVSADNRFILHVNGARVAAGPSLGDVARWREQTVDLARHLRPGRNVIAAIVWNAVKGATAPAGATPEQRAAAQAVGAVVNTAPKFQQSIATGFRLTGDGDAAAISTDRPGWRVRRDDGHGFGIGFLKVRRWFYVAGSPETIDAGKSPADWMGPAETGGGWADAIPAPAAARPLIADPLPPQLYRPAPAGTVVRSDLPGA